MYYLSEHLPESLEKFCGHFALRAGGGKVLSRQSQASRPAIFRVEILRLGAPIPNFLCVLCALCGELLQVLQHRNFVAVGKLHALDTVCPYLLGKRGLVYDLESMFVEKIGAIGQGKDTPDPKIMGFG